MNGSRVLSLALCLSIVILFGCTDDNIEGAAKTTSNIFALVKTTSSFTTVNNGTCGTSAARGTDFTLTIEYNGTTEVITGISVIVKFSGGTPSSPQTVSGWVDSREGGSSGSLGGFRTPTSSAASNVKINRCVVFGTANTSVQYDFTVTTQPTTGAAKTYTSTVTVAKPTGAN